MGSSDAARLYAFDVPTGRTRWDLDVMGWAWGEPTVTETLVFIGTAGVANYPVKHLPGVLGVDCRTGRVAWRYPANPTPAGTFGFPASPAVGDGLVVIGGVDGRVYAFTQ